MYIYLRNNYRQWSVDKSIKHTSEYLTASNVKKTSFGIRRIYSPIEFGLFYHWLHKFFNIPPIILIKICNKNAREVTLQCIEYRVCIYLYRSMFLGLLILCLQYSIAIKHFGIIFLVSCLPYTRMFKHLSIIVDFMPFIKIIQLLWYIYI